MAITDNEIVSRHNQRNSARFFVTHRHVAWVLLIATFFWGIYGYLEMPQRKDPDIPVRRAVALCPWPGTSAERVEQLITRRIEEQMVQNAAVEKVESISRTGLSVVYVVLDENIDAEQRGKEFDDIKLRLDGIKGLPEGAGPINFIKDFGDTATLLLSVASPKAGETELSLRAREVQRAIEQMRAMKTPVTEDARVTLLIGFPLSLSTRLVHRHTDRFASFASEKGILSHSNIIEGPGFIGLDGHSRLDDGQILEAVQTFIRERLNAAELHPDTWQPAVIRNPADTVTRLSSAAGDKYTYRELDNFTDRIAKAFQTLPQVSKVTRSGVLDERVYLDYSQERLAAYALQPSTLGTILSGRNIEMPGGMVEAQGRNVTIVPSGEFTSEQEIADVLVDRSTAGVPVYLRDLVEINRGYQSPARYLNFHNWLDQEGQWQRTRAVTLSVQMRAGEQIERFALAADELLEELRTRLPEDLIITKVSDQPLQVEEKVGLFMQSLGEAIVLVVLVAALGFRDWRSATLIALSIPVTLAMTFGIIHFLGIDLQQVSIASLILALGLLVDDPVVAGDAIKRELEMGRRPLIAAWLGPTKLVKAIWFATITNVVAYLPFLLLSGDIGRFLYSLPVVVASALLASRIASTTFVPLLGFYLLRNLSGRKTSVEELRSTAFGKLYYRAGGWMIRHRWKVLLLSFGFLGAGVYFGMHLQQSFFPKDLSHLSYVDVWLAEDAPLSETRRVVKQAERLIRDAAAEYGQTNVDDQGSPRQILESVTSYIGGGAPRFWFSVSPELQQLNYAQIIVRSRDNRDTAALIAPLQKTLSANVAGARIDVRQLETGKPVGVPVSLRLSGDDIPTLRKLAEEVKNILRGIPQADRVRDDWGSNSFAMKLRIDSDRANLAGLSNLDVALASSAAMNGFPVTSLREGHRQIPVLARLAVDERSQLSDIRNLYVYSTRGEQKVPIEQVASIDYQMLTEKIRRRNQFRTITVSAFPVPGVLPSQVLGQARVQLGALEKTLPPGYRMEIGGEEEEQVKGFKELATIMGISIAAIFLALVVQFNHAIKPFIVFAAVPYGIAGALGALVIAGEPFGFMAFLGVASLIGVIVSHIIVLFDFIEKRREEGDALQDALLTASIMRLRPVMITVGAAVIALVPLALHGGPLWEPLCYAQIGGLSVATLITLFLVPVLYAIFVQDLKWVEWEGKADEDTDG